VLAFGTQVRGFAPGRSRRIFGAKKILRTPSFVGEVKPSVPRHSFTEYKRSLNVTWRSSFRQNLPDISCLQFRVSPLGALAWRRLVAEVGTSNQDGTVSLKAVVHSCINGYQVNHLLKCKVPNKVKLPFCLPCVK
jgi:hypothetical protein